MRFECHLYGHTSEQTLVLLHPGGVLHRIWLPMIQRWSNKYQIIAFDLYPPLPGESYSLNLVAQNLTNHLLSMSFQTFNLVGASFGANIALHMAIQAPDQVRSLVIDSAQVGSPKTSMGLSTFLSVAEIIIQLLPSAFIENLLIRQFKHLNAQEQQIIQQDLKQLGKLAFVRHAKANLEHYVEDQLHQIHCPVLIFAGEKDILTKTGQHQQLFSSINDAHLIMMPGAGHATFLTQPNTFVSAIEEFWESTQRLS